MVLMKQTNSTALIAVCLNIYILIQKYPLKSNISTKIISRVIIGEMDW